jgi:Flp pilus assembly protein TadG
MVEFAVVMPVMFLLIVGSVDICNAIYLKQFITEVSYQGTMEGSRPGATEERIEAVLDSFLEARGIKNGSVSIAGLNGQAYDSLSEGEYFEVVVNGSSQPLFAGAVSNAMIDLEGRSVSARQ